MVAKIGSVPRETLPNRPPKSIRKQRTKRYKTTGYRSKIPARPPLEKFSCTPYIHTTYHKISSVRILKIASREEILWYIHSTCVHMYVHRQTTTVVIMKIFNSIYMYLYQSSKNSELPTTICQSIRHQSMSCKKFPPTHLYSCFRLHPGPDQESNPPRKINSQTLHSFTVDLRISQRIQNRVDQGFCKKLQKLKKFIFWQQI